VLEIILSFLVAIRVFFRSRSDTAVEVLAFRQQIAVLKRKRTRPALSRLDRLFWTILRRYWLRWADVLVIMNPDTVVGWHCAGFHSTGGGVRGNGAVDQRSVTRFVC
jgi:putative transposase